jgi:ankyrin repeat protein
LKVGADPNRFDKVGQTPLVAAAKKCRTAIIKVLLNNGADPEIPDISDRTPLQIAKRYGYLNVVELLGGVGPATGLAQLRRAVGVFIRAFDS